MVYQYYAKCVTNNYNSLNDHYDLVDRIAESFSWGDVAENIIYGDQNWNMQEIHGMYTCVIPSYNLCTNRDLETPIECDLKFAADPNKTSIKRINKRNINNASKCLNNMDIIDYINMNKIIRKLIENGDIKTCAKLFSGYNVKLEHIESLLKIDKINSSSNETKITLKSKQKKEFIAFLEEYKNDTSHKLK